MLTKVVSLELKFAIVEIVAVNGCKLNHYVEGIIKKEHMDDKNIDSIKIEEMMSIGDIVLAKIKSLSETRKILLSIEEENMGVIISRESNGNFLRA